MQKKLSTIEQINFAVQAARVNLLAYSMLMYPPFESNWHLRVLARKLEAVERGEIKRLMVFMPPRSGKSVECSQMFPSWYLGKHPDEQIICATYGHSLASKFGRDVRNLVADQKYNMVFPDVTLADDSKSKNIFNTNKNGVYMATGVGGAMTGYGANCIAGGSLIITNNGKIPIENIKVGDIVFDGEKWDKVVAVADNGVKECIGVKVHNDILYCTPDHLVLTSNGWKNAMNLTLNDYVYLSTVQRGVYPKGDEKIENPKVLLIKLQTGISASVFPEFKKVVHKVWGEVQSAFRSKILLQHDLRRSRYGGDGENKETKRYRVSLLQKDVSTIESSNKTLFDGMQKQNTCCKNGEKEKSKLSKITSFKKSKRCRVYDIQTENSHRFVANNIVVHNCLLIDDAHKDRQEANSEVMRNNVWDWYTSTAHTRLMPGGKIVIVMTRWHDDDLAGRILASEGDKWEVVSFPAIAEKNEEYRKAGEALWPERYSIDDLLSIKSSIGTEEFSCLYQQNPINEEAAEFKRSWFKYYRDDQCPGNLRIFTTVDPAISKKASADYSCVMTVGVAPDNSKYILEYTNERLNPSELIEEIFRHYDKFNPDMVGIETVAYQEALSHFLQIEMRKRNKFMRIEEYKTREDKQMKIRGLIAHYKSGSIYHRAGMCETLEEQLLRFPRGAHDDVIDSLAAQMQFWYAPNYAIHQPTNNNKTIRQLMQDESKQKLCIGQQ